MGDFGLLLRCGKVLRCELCDIWRNKYKIGCTNSGYRFTELVECCTVARNVCGIMVWTLVCHPSVKKGRGGPPKFLGKICVPLFKIRALIHSLSHSFHWHVQDATIPCRSQDLLPFVSVMYIFLPPFSTNYSSILPHFILPSISWSTSRSSCSQIHI